MEKSLKSKKKNENMLWVSNNGTQIFPILKRESWICQNTGQTQKWTLFYVNWKKHKWQQYWITSKLTILLCLLNELLGVIHPFNPFSLCISMLWQFFWTFLPCRHICASRVPPPHLRMWFHGLIFSKLSVTLLFIIAGIP